MTSDWTEVGRRSALRIMSGGALISACPALARMDRALPTLATRDQIDAERSLLTLLADPELKAIQASMVKWLASLPAGQTADGAATLDNAVLQYTNSLIFKQISAYRAAPGIVYGTDDTPRHWLGHTIGGVGTGGDNPDAIYRMGFVDGAGQYEILGRINMAKPPAQFVVQLNRTGPVPVKLLEQSRKRIDPGTQIALLTNDTMQISPDGRFRITLGGEGSGPNHVVLPSGLVTYGFRDVLSDWTQRPTALSIRRTDGIGPQPYDPSVLRQRVIDQLADYIRYWGPFASRFMGGLEPNTSAGPIRRIGNWGFMAALRFALEPGEVMIVETMRGGARYTGTQVTDPWFIGADAMRSQGSLNNTQATPNEDGSLTYVISPIDPGTANWLDTGGLHEGYLIMRWQALPADATGDELFRSLHRVPLDTVARMRGEPKTSPRRRAVQIHARQSYANRWRY